MMVCEEQSWPEFYPGDLVTWVEDYGNRRVGVVLSSGSSSDGDGGFWYVCRPATGEPQIVSEFMMLDRLSNGGIYGEIHKINHRRIN